MSSDGSIYSHLKEQPDHGDRHIRKVEDITIGMRIRKVYPTGDTEDWEISRGPALYSAIDNPSLRDTSQLRDEWCVMAVINRPHNMRATRIEELKFLSDAGVVPYSRNTWSRAYLVRID